MTSIFSGNDGVQQIFGDEGENAQDFDAWMDGIMNGGTDAVQHVAAPILGSFANFSGNSSNGDGETLSQGVYDEIVRASPLRVVVFSEGRHDLNMGRRALASIAPVPRTRAGVFGDHHRAMQVAPTTF